MRFALLIPVLMAMSCAKQPEEKALISLLPNLYTVAADTVLIDRAEQAMEAWQIGLYTGFRARYRNAGGAAGTYDPPNWVAIAPRNCMVMGAPGDMRSNCPLASPSVVGVCQIVNDSITGQILNTTMLVARDYQTNENETLANRLSIFIHEFGHCLGLQHSASTADVMYANTSGADTPSAAELSVIQHAYTLFQDPPDTTRFFSSNGKVVRHFRMPAFFLYDEANYQTHMFAVPPDPPVNPVEVHNILIFADGSEVYYRSR